jgi:predicted DsbA family dithiol-disulfide isomerase
MNFTKLAIMTATLELWIDLGCPWSRMLLVEIEDAQKQFGKPVDITFRALRIDPDGVDDYGQTTIEHLVGALGITEDEAEGMLKNVIDEGKNYGLEFNFRIARGGNSMKAHRLIKEAHSNGTQLQVSKALFEGHFAQGKLISDLNYLKEVADQFGLDSSFLATEKFVQDVLDDEAAAAKKSITNTPTGVINGKHYFEGLKPASVILSHLAD